MPKSKTAYIATTALFCVLIAPSAVMNIVQPEMVVEAMARIQMPLYVLTLMGIWKVLGIVALARPNLRWLNEWAYAGFFFDLTGAAFSHGAGGDWMGVAPPLVFLCLLMTSYTLRNKVDQA